MSCGSEDTDDAEGEGEREVDGFSDSVSGLVGGADVGFFSTSKTARYSV